MPRSTESKENLEEASARRRAKVVRSYLTEFDVQVRLDIDDDKLTSWREGRKVLAVWHQPIKAWLYPDFQFDRDGLIREMPGILAAFDRYYGHVWKNTWMILEWFFSGHRLLVRT